MIQYYFWSRAEDCKAPLSYQGWGFWRNPYIPPFHLIVKCHSPLFMSLRLFIGPATSPDKLKSLMIFSDSALCLPILTPSSWYSQFLPRAASCVEVGTLAFIESLTCANHCSKCFMHICHGEVCGPVLDCSCKL